MRWVFLQTPQLHIQSWSKNMFTLKPILLCMKHSWHQTNLQPMFFKFCASLLFWLLHILCLYLHLQNHCPQQYRQNEEQPSIMSKKKNLWPKAWLLSTIKASCVWMGVVPALALDTGSWPTHQSSQPAPLPFIISSTCSIKPQLFHQSLPDCCSSQL